ncbi:aldehyde dehydrogenase family protein [Escherichia coli]|nr:aldehyde dehydrogenase family protein [Escherichia coli]
MWFARKADDRGGNFFQPTILVDVPANAKVSKVARRSAPLPRYSALKMKPMDYGVNDTEFGLAAYFYARDLSRVFRGRGAEYGIVGINTGIISNEVVHCSRH